MDRRIVLGEELVADDHPMAGADSFGDLHRRGSEFFGPEISGRRIDQITSQERGAGEPLDPAAIGAFGPDQCGGGAALCVVAGKGIGAERPAERELCRIGALRSGFEPIASLRQRLGQSGERPNRLGGIARLAEADQHPVEPAPLPRHQGELADVG